MKKNSQKRLFHEIYTSSGIWFPDHIIDDSVDAGVGRKYYLRVFCYLSLYRTFAFRCIVPYKFLCEFIGITNVKYAREKMALINEVLDDMVFRGIILDEIKFTGTNDIIKMALNPNYFVPMTKAQKNAEGVEEAGAKFQYFSEESYMKILNYKKEDYNPKRRSISVDKLLAVYMHLLTCMFFRVDRIRTLQEKISHPLGGMFTYVKLAEQLEYDRQDVANACEILRDDLKLIFYGDPIRVNTKKAVKDITRVVVERLPADDHRFDWQQEYINECEYAKRSIRANHTRAGQYIKMEYPPEIQSYLDMKMAQKAEHDEARQGAAVSDTGNGSDENSSSELF